MLELFVITAILLIFGTVMAIAISFQMFMDTLTGGEYGNKERDTNDSIHRNR